MFDITFYGGEAPQPRSWVPTPEPYPERTLVPSPTKAKVTSTATLPTATLPTATLLTASLPTSAPFLSWSAVNIRPKMTCPTPSLSDKIPRGGYKQIHLFDPSEIHYIHTFYWQAMWKSTAVYLTRNGKVVIQQPGMKACTATCTAMLLMDAGKEPDHYSFSRCSISPASSMTRSLVLAGLKPTKVDITNLEDIIPYLPSAPLIVSINDTALGGHVIILDAWDNEAKLARIREPYHGLEMIVTLDALARRVDRLSYLIHL